MSAIRNIASRGFKVIFVALAIVDVPVAHAATDDCTLLTVAEVSAAVGATVSGPVPSVNNGVLSCAYSYGQMNQIGYDLYRFASPAEARKNFGDQVEGDGAEAPGYKRAIEPGLGDKAFFRVSTTGGVMTKSWIYVLQGSRFFVLGSFANPAVSREHLRALALAALNR